MKTRQGCHWIGSGSPAFDMCQVKNPGNYQEKKRISVFPAGRADPLKRGGNHLSKKMTPRQKNEAKWGLIFVAPTMIGLAILNFYPIVMTIWQSLCKTGDFGKGNKFVGLANYQKVLTSAEAWQSFINTLKYAIIEVPFGIVIALILAVLLNKKIAGRSIYRTIFFLPMVCAPAAVAMVWKWLYNTQFGLINNVFHTNVAWISDPHIAWISIGVIGVWSIIGYNMVLFIGGLQEIPGDFYEAAAIDGAGGFRQFWNITVPLLSPTTFFIVQTRIIGALTVFDLMFMVMDKTNVALKSVQSVVYLFYQYAFVNGNKGYGATLVIVLLVFIMIITFILQQLEKRIVYHN